MNKIINSSYSLYVLLSISTLFSEYLFRYILGYEELYINSLSYQLTEEQIYEVLDLKSNLEWLGWVLTPTLLIIKISLIAAILDAGCFFFSKNISYKKMFNIAVKAEFIFLLVIISKIVWFSFFKVNYTLEDLQYFYPLSALNIIGYEGLETWFIYPFQVLNFFELIYWLSLAYLLGKELKINTEKGLSIVSSSYGIILLIWVVTVMFFTLNMS